MIHVTDATDSNSEQSVPMWMKIGRITLQEEYKEMILKGFILNNVIINAAQFLLKEQFPDILGLQYFCQERRNNIGASLNVH